MKPDSPVTEEDAVAGRQPESRTDVEDAVTAHARWTPYIHHSSYQLCFILFVLRNGSNAVAGLRGPVGDSVRLARTCSEHYRTAMSYI